MRGKPKEHTFSSKSVTVKFTLLFYDAKSCLARSSQLVSRVSLPPVSRCERPWKRGPWCRGLFSMLIVFVLIIRVVFQFVKGQLHVISLQRVLALNVDIILWAARLAQSVEHQTFNLRVIGWSPISGDKHRCWITLQLVQKEKSK